MVLCIAPDGSLPRKSRLHRPPHPISGHNALSVGEGLNTSRPLEAGVLRPPQTDTDVIE